MEVKNIGSAIYRSLYYYADGVVGLFLCNCERVLFEDASHGYPVGLNMLAHPRSTHRFLVLVQPCDVFTLPLIQLEDFRTLAIRIRCVLIYYMDWLVL